MKKSTSGLSHALLSLETLAGVNFLLIFMGLVPLAGSGWDFSGVGLTLGHGESVARGLDGEIQMWRAGTGTSLWLLGCGERGQGLGRFMDLAEFTSFVPFTSGSQKPWGSPCHAQLWSDSAPAQQDSSMLLFPLHFGEVWIPPAVGLGSH